MSLHRLHRWYQQSSPEQRKAGRLWYPRARGKITQLSARHFVSYRTAAGIVAVLSPNTTWELNLIDADRLLTSLAYQREYGGTEHYHELVVTTYHANKLKAWTFGETGDISYIRGAKVVPFFYNLLGDDNALTIDSHAFNAWWGKRMIGSRISRKPRKAERQACERAYRRVADINGLMPSEIQATIWLFWRDRIASGIVPGY